MQTVQYQNYYFGANSYFGNAGTYAGPESAFPGVNSSLDGVLCINSSAPDGHGLGNHELFSGRRTL